MCGDSKHGIRGEYFQSIAKGLLEQPLEFIQKDYLKPQICSLIDEIVLHPSQKSRSSYLSDNENAVAFSGGR